MLNFTKKYIKKQKIENNDLKIKMFNINQLISTSSTSTQLLGLLSQKELHRLRNILFPERFKFITPKNMRRFNDHRFRKQLQTINSAKKESKELIIEEITQFEFTPAQIKIMILILKILEIIGAPTNKLIEIMEESEFPCFSKNPAHKVRYSFLGFYYEKPSVLIRKFIEKANNRMEIIEFLYLEDEDINSKLITLAIPNSFNSLPSSCTNYARYFFLNELFQLRDYRRITEELEIYPNEPKKWQQAIKLTFYSNIALTDLIDKLDDKSLDAFKEYFLKKYFLNETILFLNNTQIRKNIKGAMELRGECRNKELWADPHVAWGGETKLIAKDGHICDSKWELEIDNYLFDSGIEHIKPLGAPRGKYYRNRMMYPDWIINGVMIELFGAVHYKDYKDRMEYKQNNNLLPLKGISKEEYETGAWRYIIQGITNFQA